MFGKSANEFLPSLECVFAAIVLFNVRLKPSKCEFGYDEVTFLGHVFNADGYHLSDDRKQGIYDMQPPKSLKQLRSFLGMVNFFRDFIEHLSEVLLPLSEATKTSKLTAFVWTEEMNVAFNDVKKLVMNAGTLQVLQDEGNIMLFTDASQVGIGATLMQQDIHSKIWRPVLYLSRKFSEAAKKWSTIEQEYWAIVYAVHSLSSYLLGRHF